MSEGEESDFMLLIIKGHMKVTTGQPPRIVAFRGPSETVGEQGVLDSEPRSATVTAWSEVEVLHVPAAEFRKFLQAHPDANDSLNAMIRKRLTQASRKIPESDLGMELRIAKAFVDLVENDICEVVDGVPVISMSQKDLSSITGASVPATKKIVHVFRHKGFIDTRRLLFRITDIDALRRIADGKPMSSW
jgi:CRP/FNR family cyclic AMP-dependent transcriptional regulator